MAKIRLVNVEYYHSAYFTPVFDDVSLDIDTNWKLGLVGRNGRGKTTLLKMLHEELKPTRGRIIKDIQTDIFPFHIENTSGTALNVIKECIAPFEKWEHKMELLEQQMATSDSLSCREEYSKVIEMYTFYDGFNIESIIKKELSLMCLKEEILYRNYETLSEGEKYKLQILSLFLRKNNFLLIDEPTNHLDVDGRSVIGEYLNKKTGFIVVSHDREFLNMTTDHTLSINKANIYIEKGNFDSWYKNKQLKDEHEKKVKDNLVRDIAMMEKQSKNQRKWSAIKETKTPVDKGNYKKAQSSSQMKKALIAEKRIKANIAQKRELLKNIELDNEIIFEQENLEVHKYIIVEDLQVKYNGRKIIDKLNFTLNKGDRIWIKGRNGSGKSTLLNALVSNCYDSGIIWKNCELIISYSQQTQILNNSTIMEIISIIDDKELFIQLLDDFEIDNKYFDKPIDCFSEGEKKKIDIAKSLATNNNVLIWDEPLNYLDIISRLQIERAILKINPTLIFVEHDNSFGTNISTKIIELNK